MKKKFMFGLPFALSGVAAFAEGEQADYINLSALSSVATELGTDIKALFTGDILTAVATILGGVVVVWGLGIIWKWIRHTAK